jgi:hypothetical protein
MISRRKDIAALRGAAGGSTPRGRRSMTDMRMAPEQVEAFCAGRLDEAGEEDLAWQVSEVVAAVPLVPNQATTYLERVVKHLGGQGALLDWLAKFPGEPALVAATLQLVDLLSALSGRDPVVDAVRELRAAAPDAEPLRPYLPPDTDHVTLSDLAEGLLTQLRAQNVAQALQLGFASLDLIEAALRRASQESADVAVALDATEEVRQGLVRAQQRL